MPLTSVSARTARDLLLAACASALISILWIASVPPFEGFDELYSYNRALQFSTAPTPREPIFYRIASGVLRLVPHPAGVVEPRSNPAFSHVGNERGTVNGFEHERPVAARGHVRAIYMLRVVVAMLAVLTALCIYGIARLTLDNPNAALACALICSAVPQFSFMNAGVHSESVTRLFGAAVTLVVVAGIRGYISRPAMWGATALMVAATPFADRQGFFAVGLAGIGIVMAERTWRRSVVTALALALPVVAVAVFVGRYNDGGNLGQWFQLLRHPLRPLLYPDPSFGPGNPPEGVYYVFEFLPKLFISFWGWLGLSTILMPPAVYGALGALTMVGVAGALFVLLTGRSALTAGHPRRLRVLRVLACGIAIMCVPIAYGPAMAGRNLWYGRWLFPMMGPIILLLGVGWAAVLETPTRRRRAAIAAGIIGAVAGGLWIASPGAAFRAALYANHYGDRAHLVAVVRDTVIALLATAAVLEISVRRPALAALLQSVRTPAAAAIALNGAILAVLVAPLYAPMTADDYVTLIRQQVAQGRQDLAADVYVSAVQVYPESAALRTLAIELPRLLISARLNEMSGLLEQQLARGARLEGRDTWLALAHSLRENGGGRSEAVRYALDDGVVDPNLAEPTELVRIVLDRALADPSAAARLIRAGRGRTIESRMRNGEAVLEGVTIHTLADGSVQLIVYYRPLIDWTNRRLWLHAFPDGEAPAPYMDPDPVMIGSSAPKPGELDWVVFQLPPGHYQGYVGIWAGTNMGDAYPVGPLP